MSERINSVDFWVEELTKDISDFNVSDVYNDMTPDIRNGYGQWMWNCGYNAGLVNLQTKVNTYCVPQWISVEDKMPKCGELVIIYVANLNKGKGDYALDKCRKVDGKKEWEFYNRHNAGFDVTHWMPFPQKPKSESDA